MLFFCLRGVTAEASPGATVCLQPLGPHSRKLLTVAKAGIEYLFKLPVTILPNRALPKSAYYKPRQRYRADKIIDYLDKLELDGCTYVMGFTNKDISTTKGKHKDWGILGLATIGGPSSVVSTHRTGRTSRRNRQMRVVKVVNHELGHSLGIPHVPKKGCLMQDAHGTIKTVDGESGLLCESSRQYIEDTHGITLPKLKKVDWRLVLK